jgi:hypothetical protein
MKRILPGENGKASVRGRLKTVEEPRPGESLLSPVHRIKV